jgi:hypothetical protein
MTLITTSVMGFFYKSQIKIMLDLNFYYIELKDKARLRWIR